MDTYIHTCMHVCMHACMHASMHTYMHTYIPNGRVPEFLEFGLNSSTQLSLSLAPNSVLGHWVESTHRCHRDQDTIPD